MTSDDAARRITVVGWLFFCFGWLTVVKIAWDLLHGNIDFDFGVLGIWVGRGLLRRKENARRLALLLLWFELVVGTVLCLVMLALHAPVKLSLLGMQFLPVNPLVGLPILAIGAALTVWQLQVLMDPVVKAKFAQLASTPTPEQGQS